MASLEGRADVASDRARVRQGAFVHSLPGGAPRWVCSGSAAALVLALMLREREEISRGLATGSSIREIAKRLKRVASTVSREVARHGGRPAYRASQADGEAGQSALRPKRCLLFIHLKLRNIVASKLILNWSPEQIPRWLKIQYPDDESMRVPRNHLPNL
jgi:IS30 family transposase